jgi:MoaA/NifB/PqqE/SkfB family radical SAM enzyme
MTPGEISRWTRELIDTQPVKIVTAHGGEPFLCPGVLRSMVKTAGSLGISSWVITNGFFADDERSAREILRSLTDLGLSGITFSVDAFHQEFIPIESVRTGIEAALSAGIETVAVDSYLIGSGSPYDVRTSRLLEALEGLEEVQFNEFYARCEGRAADLLIEEWDPKGVPEGECRLPYWIGGDLSDPDGIEIDPAGNVTLCPGVRIGNARRTSLSQVLESYDPMLHPILRVIREKGPIGLLDLARSRGYRGDERFLDECHLCYRMRGFLRPYHPDDLAPESVYVESKGGSSSISDASNSRSM